MKAVNFCLTSLLLFCTSFAQADKILLLGDSLSAAYGIEADESWVVTLARDLENHEIVNASVSGDTTGGGLSRLPRLLEEVQPDWLLIELGGNDGLRGYPLQSIRSNLEQMIELALAEGIRPILMQILIPPNYGERYTEAFAAIYRDLASGYQIPMLEFMLRDIGLDSELMQEDGIHPTARAQPMIAETVGEELKPILQ